MSLTLALALSLTPVSLGAAPVSEPHEMEYRSFRNWKFELPAEAFQPLQGGISLAHAGGERFAAEVKGAGLWLDTDGDGTLDQEIEGIEDPVTKERSARVVLNGKRSDGSDFTYAVRLKDAGKGWQWATGGAMVGKLQGIKVHLFDLNGNGVFNEVGEDAMAVGSSKSATFLSKTVHLGQELYEVQFSPNGSVESLQPFRGETGTFDLATKLNAKGKLLHAMVRSADGKHFYDLARLQDPKVPAGYYKVLGGQLGLGQATVDVDARKMKAIQVPAGGEVHFAWGGPVRAEFDYQREGDQVTFDPNQVWFYGAAGERYLGWDPIGKSPEFTILEKKLGTELEKALFPGSC